MTVLNILTKETESHLESVCARHGVSVDLNAVLSNVQPASITELVYGIHEQVYLDIIAKLVEKLSLDEDARWGVYDYIAERYAVPFDVTTGEYDFCAAKFNVTPMHVLENFNLTSAQDVDVILLMPLLEEE